MHVKCDVWSWPNYAVRCFDNLWINIRVDGLFWKRQAEQSHGKWDVWCSWTPNIEERFLFTIVDWTNFRVLSNIQIASDENENHSASSSTVTLFCLKDNVYCAMICAHVACSLTTGKPFFTESDFYQSDVQ